ncbi:terminase small subunit [uncultured Anaerofustis sp.]|uniref:terminase small subunit n=1 Tax=uncultured Anaerofustis sp. TaxID=904996 RepID=UPI0025FC5CC0|nr:terminase small subunit [uncultured Anaerofustis sp.]
MKGLTEKQIKFCIEYAKTGSAELSAIAAGYSKKSAKNSATKNLQNADVLSYIEKLIKDMNSDKIADTKEVLEYLTSVMRREKTESVVVTLTNEESRYEDVGNGKLKQVKVKKEVPEIIEIPSKLSDANRAAELLGKRYGIWSEKLEIENKNREIKVELVDD